MDHNIIMYYDCKIIESIAKGTTPTSLQPSLEMTSEL